MLVTASEYLEQHPDQRTGYTSVHRNYMWNYHNTKPKGTIVNVLV